MTTTRITGILLIALPVAYNVLYTLLARSFDSPDILRRPTFDVLQRFTEGGTQLILTWWGFAMSAVLLAPTAVLVSATFADANLTILSMASATGCSPRSSSSLAHPLALCRAALARAVGDPIATAPTKDSVDIVFQTLNRYLGLAVGEHLGYLLTGFWTALVGATVVQSDVLHPAVGIIGLILAPLFLIGAMEFVGPFELRGWRFAGSLVPIAYIGWSLWLLATGIFSCSSNSGCLAIDRTQLKPSRHTLLARVPTQGGKPCTLYL